MKTNTIDKADLFLDLSNLKKQVKQLELIFSGFTLGKAKIRDLAITNAKIVTISADKLTAGSLDVGEYILIGENILIGNGIVRISLPNPAGGYYDPFTDTNLDHYSLYSDVDNVLIKQKLYGAGNLPYNPPDSSKLSVVHNLGYLPLCVGYAEDDGFYGVSAWSIVNNSYNPFQVPLYPISAIDTTTFYIVDFGGVSYPNGLNYAYHIFYDDMFNTGSPSITEGESIIKVVRPGKSRTTLNPNDCIMHSDLNNFKILKQAKVSGVTIANGFTTIAHGANIQAPVKYFIFLKFPDGKTSLIGGGDSSNVSYDDSRDVYAMVSTSNIYIRNYLSSFTADIFYIIYGSGVDDSETFSDPIIGVSDNGLTIDEAVVSGNPDNFKFLSTKQTLKYFDSDSYEMTVSSQTIHTIAHGLDYTPVIIPFVNDFSGLSNAIFGGNDVYALAPFYWSRSTIVDPLKNIASFVYWDSTNIYLKAYYQANAAGTSKTFKFYWKIFKNNTGL